MPKKQHGGRRPGAGRPTVYTEPMKEHRIFLPDAMWDMLQAIGEGNASAGVRQIVEEWQQVHKA